MTPLPQLNPDGGWQQRLSRYWHPLSEFLHTTVVYLGIAVLVTAVLALSMPSIRDQTRQWQQVAGAILKSQPWQAATSLVASGHTSNDIDPMIVVSPLMAAEELTWSNDAELISGQAGDRVDLAHLNFTRALSQSEGDVLIPGVSATQKAALQSYIARKYRIASQAAGALVHTAFIVGNEMDLDPQLLLAVIAIESRYNPYAESHMGAQGLMQVMTRVHEEKFAAFGEGALAALHPLANIRVGAQILSDCIMRRGSLEGGLACYVGATGPSDGGYGAKVKAEHRRIALASGIPITH